MNQHPMDMIEVKTEALIGQALDWAASVADAPLLDLSPEWSKEVIGRIVCGYRPSEYVTYGAPLIVRGYVSAIYEPVDEPGAPGVWRAFCRHDGPEFVHACWLVACLRARVHSKMGDVVWVPAMFAKRVDQP